MKRHNGQPSKSLAVQPPAPNDRDCLARLPGCLGKAPPIWEDEPHGRWKIRLTCNACRAELELIESCQIFEEAQRRARIPEKLRCWSMTRVLAAGRSEEWGPYRNRLMDHEDHLGITSWNVEAAKRIRDWSPATSTSLYVGGPVGGGKSTLLAARANDLLRKGTDLAWVAEAEMLQARPQLREALMTRAISASVLVIDDLGVTSALNRWQRDFMEQLFVRRYRDNRPVMISANLPLQAQGKAHSIARQYGARVASRLVEMLGGNLAGLPGYILLRGYDWRTDQEHARPGLTVPDPPTKPSGRPDHAKAAANDDS